MKLLGKRIIVREQKEEAKTSVIIIETEETKPFFVGEVVATGTESPFDVGHKVLLNRYAGGTVEWEGETLQLFTPEDVIAIEQ